MTIALSLLQIFTLCCGYILLFPCLSASVVPSIKVNSLKKLCWPALSLDEFCTFQFFGFLLQHRKFQAGARRTGRSFHDLKSEAGKRKKKDKGAVRALLPHRVENSRAGGTTGCRPLPTNDAALRKFARLSHGGNDVQITVMSVQTVCHTASLAPLPPSILAR